MWLLKTQEKYFSKVFFEDQISINKHWLGFEYATEDVETLVMHYAGCTICKPPEVVVRALLTPVAKKSSNNINIC